MPGSLRSTTASSELHNIDMATISLVCGSGDQECSRKLNCSPDIPQLLCENHSIIPSEKGVSGSPQNRESLETLNQQPQYHQTTPKISSQHPTPPMHLQYFHYHKYRQQDTGHGQQNKEHTCVLSVDDFQRELYNCREMLHRSCKIQETSTSLLLPIPYPRPSCPSKGGVKRRNALSSL